MQEHVDYRLAFVLPESRQLLGLTKPGPVDLPRISISAGRRPAEQLTRVIEERWKINTVVLDFLVGDLITTPCAVIEVRTPNWGFAGEGFCSIQPDEINPKAIGENEYRALASILSGDDTDRSPFSRIGWIEEMQKWIQEVTNNQEINFNGDIQQLNAGGRFALIRLGRRHASAYWLKAVGEPNEHEFQITKILTNLFPNYLPTMVATRDSWNAWVTEDAGQTLSDCYTSHSLEKAAFCLAELQRQAAEHLPALVAVGCRNRSISTIETQLAELREYLEKAMSLQTSAKVPQLKGHRLRELESILHDACSRMQDLGIQDALVHYDMNPGNILVGGSRCVFVDWAEAAIGNPFLSFQHLCANLSNRGTELETYLPSMRNAYKRVWVDSLPESEIEVAFALMPILAIASYMYGRGDWLNTPRAEQPAFQGYMRSLARYLDRAACAPELKGILCH